MSDANKPQVDPEFIGPDDVHHKAIHDAVKALTGTNIVQPARRQLRDALDEADREGSTHLPPKTGFFGKK